MADWTVWGVGREQAIEPGGGAKEGFTGTAVVLWLCTTQCDFQECSHDVAAVMETLKSGSRCGKYEWTAPQQAT
jgi:hypothetical protein